MNEIVTDSEQRLRLALATGQIGLWVWDSSNVANAGDWSDRLKEIFGLPLEAEVTHELFLSCVHPEDRERVNAGVMAALAGERNGEYAAEYRAIRADDGSHRYVTARGQAFFDEVGRAVRFIGTVMDLTEQKYVESELQNRIAKRTTELRQEMEERKRALDTIPALVWTALADGSIEYLNKRWLDYTGLTLDQARQWGWQRAVHPEDLPGLVAYWNGLIGDGRAGEYEARLRGSDETYRWFLFRGVPLHDQNGRVTRWYGTNTDIQALRNSEHVATGQLHALRNTLKALAQESDPDRLLEHVVRRICEHLQPDGIYLWNRDGRDDLVLQAVFREDRLRAPARPHLVATGAHPVWQEAFRADGDCVLGEFDVDPPRIRLMNGEGWHPWHTPTPLGTQATLALPLTLAARVEGTLELRFTRKRVFRCEDIELARALAHQAMLAIRLSRLTRESREAAVAAERNRLARDIHDTLAHTFTGVIVQLEAAEDALVHGLAQESTDHIGRAQERARAGLQEARRSVQAIRDEQDLAQALDTLIRSVTAGTNLSAELRLEGTPYSLPAASQLHLLGVCREALTNTLRHANASRFVTVLRFEAAEVVLEMRDDGKGFASQEQAAGFGLRGMHERISELQGHLQIAGVQGQGTTVRATVPR
jgi:PAS domain S-box-containing protein